MRLLLLSLLLVGCAPKSKADGSSTATAVASATSAAREFHVKIGMGFFAEKKLAACLDHDMTFLTEEDANKFRDKIKVSSADETIFPEGCAATMKDRRPLGTCVERAKNKNGIDIGTHTMSFYAIEMLDGDGQMRKCIADGGKWDALSHDSPEYLDAEANAQLKKDEARLKQLQKQLGQ